MSHQWSVKQFDNHQRGQRLNIHREVILVLAITTCWKKVCCGKFSKTSESFGILQKVFRVFRKYLDTPESFKRPSIHGDIILGLAITTCFKKKLLWKVLQRPQKVFRDSRKFYIDDEVILFLTITRQGWKGFSRKVS